MKENILLLSAQDFAADIIIVSDKLKSIGQRQISDQIIRSGTSISANIAEGNHPQSRLDMISKFEIALKEANETENWLTIIQKAELLNKDYIDTLHKRLIKIKILLISSIKTLKERNN